MIIGFWPFIIWSVGIVIIIFIEGVFLSKYLDNKLFNKKIVQIVAISNIVTLILGQIKVFYIFWETFSGPILSRLPIGPDELIVYKGGIEIVIAFIITLIVESIINTFFLVTDYKWRRILFGTLISNLITYSILTLLIVIFADY